MRPTPFSAKFSRGPACRAGGCGLLVRRHQAKPDTPGLPGPGQWFARRPHQSPAWAATTAAQFSASARPIGISRRRRRPWHGIGVNAFLWRGALDTIAFMPLDVGRSVRRRHHHRLVHAARHQRRTLQGNDLHPKPRTCAATACGSTFSARCCRAANGWTRRSLNRRSATSRTRCWPVPAVCGSSCKPAARAAPTRPDSVADMNSPHKAMR